jgi:hypothetical protein
MIILGVGLSLTGCRWGSDAISGMAPTGEPAQLAWLAGSWVFVEGDAVSEEVWTRPNGGTMLGVNRTVVDGRTVHFEYLRIEQGPEGVVYLASPGGRPPPTPLALAENGVYERRGERLDGRVEGEQDGRPKSEQWSWRRASVDAEP